MEKVKAYISSHKQHIVILAALIGFYIFYGIHDGPVICVDTQSYIDMSLSREPGYPLFLALNRSLFGQNLYLSAAALEQSLLMAVCLWSLIGYVYDRIEAGMISSSIPHFMTEYIFPAMLFILGIAPSLLCRYAAGRGSMYSNSILSEGLCIPLFLLFCRYAVDYLSTGSAGACIVSGIISALLITTRKQMYLTLALLCCCIILRGILCRSIVRTLAALAVCVLLIQGFNSCTEAAYSYALRGTVSRHYSDNRFLTTCVMYTAERSDGELITDPDTRGLFYEIYDLCDEEGDMFHSAGSGPAAISSHFAAHYDCIQIDHMWPMAGEYASSHLPDTATADERESFTDSIMDDITSALLPAVLPRIIHVFLCNLLDGYFNTVGKHGGIMTVYGVIIGIVYLFLLIMNIRRSISIRKETAENSADGPGQKNSRQFAVLLGIYTIISVLGNIAVVSAVIFCQNRYMIYNMPLFYITLAAMSMSLFV